MTARERCDEILRLIDDVLDGAEAPRGRDRDRRPPTPRMV